MYRVSYVKTELELPALLPLLFLLQLAIVASFDFFDHERRCQACDYLAAKTCLHLAVLRLVLVVVAFYFVVWAQGILYWMLVLHLFDFATAGSSFLLELAYEGSDPYTSHP